VPREGNREREEAEPTVSDIVLRDATAADWADVLALNQAHRPHVGALTPAELRQLHERAIHFRLAEAAGTFVGFLIALDPSAEYGSPNFLWFKARYERFAHIDRVAVVAARRRHGVGRRLYEDLETVAGARGFDLLACEYNLRPPNDDSARFHGRLGFAEVGRQDTERGQKTVSLQIKILRGSRGPITSSAFPGGDSPPVAPSAKR
jgi:predicted GNAT superfamily acetyltransferase